ncbi:MAG TPA: 4-alpha-glucanotransferase [Vineibacter sp.]|nr:4-alpha-glucanotransferase [Vineibacter sp.]
MSDRALTALARAAGVLVRWRDAFGNERTVSPETQRALLSAIGLAAGTPGQIRESRSALRLNATHPGLPKLITADIGTPTALPATAAGSRRYRLECEDGHQIDGILPDGPGMVLPPLNTYGYHRLILGDEVSTLAVAPHHGFGIRDALGHERACGLAAQLYSLRRAADDDIGDYGTLGMLAQAVAPSADALVVSPVHALFNNDPARFSPYAPSNRLFLNVLHIDVHALCAPLGIAAGEALGQPAHAHAPSSLIDWPAVAARRLVLLRQAFEVMHARGLLSPDTPTGQDFLAFRRNRGQALERHACFEALQADVLRADPTRWSWRTWPAGFTNPDNHDVAIFARDFAHEIAFHAFLQWRADKDLAAAQAAAKDAGMGLGLIADLAVGTDPAGSYAWGHQAEMLPELSVGAPPDLFNPLGQDWGLATFSPHALRGHGFAPFVNLLRAVMRHAGGVRIDHVLGLKRLWLVPKGVSANDGAYLSYPLEDMLRLVALESWRHRTVVIGEDLGTVPPGFRATLRDRGILGTRVLWFERQDTGFVSPRKWPPAAVATSSTHDLPTIVGWWTERDIDWRAELGLLGPHETPESLRADRSADRAALWQSLCAARVARGELPAKDEPASVLEAVAAFVGATRCALAVLPLEDILGLVEQPNLPGTIDSHPNWRRRLPIAIEHMMQDPAVRARIAALAAARRRP